MANTNIKRSIDFNTLVALIDTLDQQEGMSRDEIITKINNEYILPKSVKHLHVLVDELMDEE